MEGDEDGWRQHLTGPLALVLLAAAFGRGPALVGLALLFGLAHLANPGVTPLAVAKGLGMSPEPT